MTDTQRKFLSGAVVADAALGERQIRVVANSGKADRVKDVLKASGCKLDNYRLNPIVLADHDPGQPIGNFAPEIKDAVEAFFKVQVTAVQVLNQAGKVKRTARGVGHRNNVRKAYVSLAEGQELNFAQEGV